MSQFATQYKEFFTDSDAGQEYIKAIESRIESVHGEAERTIDQESSFAYVQRAKGIREVLELTRSLQMEVKKPR